MNKGERHDRSVKYESGLFSDAHKPILQAWVDGKQSVEEMAQSLGKTILRIGQLRSEITSVMDVGICKNHVAKAVVYAVVHSLVNFDLIDQIRPKRPFADRETNILTSMAMGLDNQQIAVHLSIKPDDVKVGKRDILDNLGVSSPYTVIAWGIRRSIQRLQQQSG